jgi:hypothetical protein
MDELPISLGETRDGIIHAVVPLRDVAKLV